MTFEMKEKVKVDVYSGATWIGTRIGTFQGYTKQGRCRVKILGLSRDEKNKIKSFKEKFVNKLNDEEKKKMGITNDNNSSSNSKGNNVKKVQTRKRGRPPLNEKAA